MPSPTCGDEAAHRHRPDEWDLLDGIDAALVVTDGRTIRARGATSTLPYPVAFRARLRELLGRAPAPADAHIIAELSERHAEAVEQLLAAAGLTPAAVDVVGFHGQTVLHEPAAGRTIQIGDPVLLAARLGISVVADFRIADVAAGGQGAPFVPSTMGRLPASLSAMGATIPPGRWRCST